MCKSGIGQQVLRCLICESLANQMQECRVSAVLDSGQHPTFPACSSHSLHIEQIWPGNPCGLYRLSKEAERLDSDNV
jgi:hypothetical protein